MENKINMGLVFLLAGSSALYAQQSAPAAPPAGAWPKVGGNLFSQNYSPLTQINRQNVANLKAVCARASTGRVSALGTPAKRSPSYTRASSTSLPEPTTSSPSVSLPARSSGSTTPILDQSITTVCCGWTSRGLALGEGKVFVGQLDGRLVALDQKSGETAWSIQAER